MAVWNKNFLPLPRPGSKRRTPFPFRPAVATSGLDPGGGKGIARASGICKSNVAKSAFQTLDAGGAFLAARQAPGRNAAGGTESDLRLRSTASGKGGR
jgi:hypothetical protein